MPKISALPIANSASTGDLLVLDQGNVTKRIDFNVLQSAFANAGTVQSLINQSLSSGLGGGSPTFSVLTVIGPAIFGSGATVSGNISAQKIGLGIPGPTAPIDAVHIRQNGVGIMFEDPTKALNQKVWNIQIGASTTLLEFNTFDDDYSGHINTIFSLSRTGDVFLGGSPANINATSGGLLLQQNGTTGLTIGGGGVATFGSAVVLSGTPNGTIAFGAGGATLGIADGNNTRLLITDGTPANAALRMVGGLSSSLGFDVINGNSSATARILRLQENGGGITFGGTIRPTVAAGYHSQDNSAGLTSNVIIGSKILIIKDGIITGFS